VCVYRLIALLVMAAVPAHTFNHATCFAQLSLVEGIGLHVRCSAVLQLVLDQCLLVLLCCCCLLHPEYEVDFINNFTKLTALGAKFSPDVSTCIRNKLCSSSSEAEVFRTPAHQCPSALA